MCYDSAENKGDTKSINEIKTHFIFETPSTILFNQVAIISAQDWLENWMFNLFLVFRLPIFTLASAAPTAEAHGQDADALQLVHSIYFLQLEY